MPDVHCRRVTHAVGGVSSGEIFTAGRDPDMPVKSRNTFDRLPGPE